MQPKINFINNIVRYAANRFVGFWSGKIVVFLFRPRWRTTFGVHIEPNPGNEALTQKGLDITWN